MEENKFEFTTTWKIKTASNLMYIIGAMGLLISMFIFSDEHSEHFTSIVIFVGSLSSIVSGVLFEGLNIIIMACEKILHTNKDDAQNLADRNIPQNTTDD